MKRAPTALLYLVLFLILGLYWYGYTYIHKENFQRENTLVIALSQIDTTHAYSYLDTENPIYPLVFSSLFRLNEKSQMEGDLVASYTHAPGSTEYILQLHPHLTWHDGESLTANDVAYTLAKLMTPDTHNPWYPYLQAIQEVKVLDAARILLILNTPIDNYTAYLTMPILPKHKAWHDEAGMISFFRVPVGSGPYRYKSGAVGKSLLLEANPNFHRGKPHIPYIYAYFLLHSEARTARVFSGRADVALVSPGNLSTAHAPHNNLASTLFDSKVAALDKEDLNIYRFPTLSYHALHYNINHPVLSDPRVRKALNFAMNPNDVLQVTLDSWGTLAYDPLQKTWVGAVLGDPFAYNPTKARTMLTNLGWKPNTAGILSRNGHDLSFTIVVSDADTEGLLLAESLQRNYAKLGIEVSIALKARHKINPYEEDATIIRSFGGLSPDSQTYPFFHSSARKLSVINDISFMPNSMQHSVYQNVNVDIALEQARATKSPEEKQYWYRRFQDALISNPPYNFLLYVDKAVIANKRVQGIIPIPLDGQGYDYLWNIETWTLQPKLDSLP